MGIGLFDASPTAQCFSGRPTASEGVFLDAVLEDGSVVGFLRGIGHGGIPWNFGKAPMA